MDKDKKEEETSNQRVAIFFVILLVGGILFYNFSNQQNSRVVDLQNQVQTLKNQEKTTQATAEQATQDAQVAENSAQKDSDDDTSLVNEWSPNIVHIACTSDNVNYSLGSGTVTDMNLTGGYSGPVIATNAHVVTYSSNGETYIYSTCFFRVTGQTTIYYLDPNSFRYSTDADVEWIPVQSALYPNSSFSTANINICKSSGQIGEPLVILGYPEDGGTGGNITATDGIVSSFDGQFYVTSAKVDHGNSGGAAILKNEDCYLGIPTWANSGSVESYARILNYSYVFDSN